MAVAAERERKPEQQHVPLVSAETSLPELTARGLLLGVVLSIVLGAANMYVGLKAALTVSATIPSAVISMSVLRFFKRSNVLENTVAMTTGSAGEALGAGLIFTIPALLILGVWQEVDLLPAIVVGLCGGLLGVMFTIPLRRAFIAEAQLPFPEGIATAKVLETGEKARIDARKELPASTRASGEIGRAADTGTGVRVLSIGLLLGAGYAVALQAMGLWQEVLRAGARVGSGVGYFAMSLAPILLSVGYIVGIKIARLIMLGAVLAFIVFTPALILLNGYPVDPATGQALDPVAAARTTWNPNVRLIGVGTIIIGGFYTIYKVRSSLAAAVTEGRRSFRGGAPGAEAATRTERDLPFDKVIVSIAALAVPIFLIYYYFTQSWLFAAAAALVMVPAAFLFSSVAGYLAGVVGSSNNPISSVTIVTIIFTSLLLLALGASGEAGIFGAIGVGAVIACSAAIAGDNMQDLKTGYLLGSTPRAQQLALIVGVVGMALVAPIILNVIHSTAPGGIGGEEFPAPQAGLMAGVAQAIFGGTLDLQMIGVGMLVALGLIAARLPVLPVAVGIYLPFELSTPIFAGGVLKWAMDRHASRATRGWPGPEREAASDRVERTGVLLASGIIAGEALLGITVVFLLFGDQLPGLYAPLLAAVLLGASIILLPRALGRRTRFVAGGMLILAGIATTAWLVSSGSAYAFAAGAQWPGILIFAYVALLMVYLPLRELIVHGGGKQQVVLRPS